MARGATPKLCGPGPGARVDDRERMDRLVDELLHHNRLYHEKNAPEISDYAYDELFRELERLEASRPDLVREDSPTRRVGWTAVDELRPFVHEIPMLSLQNGYKREAPDPEPWIDLRDFEERKIGRAHV